jgi:hypothetical protein
MPATSAEAWLARSLHLALETSGEPTSLLGRYSRQRADGGRRRVARRALVRDGGDALHLDEQLRQRETVGAER